MSTTSITKIYIIVNKKNEESRYDNLIKQLQIHNIKNYEFIDHTWGSEITEEIRNEYVKSDS